MNRDAVVFSICSFLLGLVIGSLLIGPRFAQRGAPPPSAAPESNPMDAVRRQIASLNDAIARDPRDFNSLSQLGAMYMDAGKFPQAIEYFERSLAIHEDPNVRTDLGICYKQAGQLDRALATFRKASEEAPASTEVEAAAPR